MLTRLATPDAYWTCHELGMTTFTRLTPDEHQVWSREEFDDAAVSRSGVSLQVVDGGWTVINRSTSMTDVYLYDVRYGRRSVPPAGSLRPQRLRSWILLPSARGSDEPHVVAVRIEQPPGAPVPTTDGADPTDGRHTERVGEPAGADLHRGLRRAAGVLEDPDDTHIIAAYARPYFEVTTGRPVPMDNRQVATCLPWARNRAGRLLTELRTAVWRRAEGQPLDVLVGLLIRHGVLTHQHVLAVPHAPGCGHTPAQVDPTMSGRRP